MSAPNNCSCNKSCFCKTIFPIIWRYRNIRIAFIFLTAEKLPVKYPLYQESKRCQQNRPDKLSDNASASGAIIVFCVFSANISRHKIDVINFISAAFFPVGNSGRHHGIAVTQFHAVMPSAPCKSCTEYAKEQKRNGRE